MAIKIELKNITKKFSNYIAVDNINITVKPAEFVCLLGPSGCGKTTTLRMIAGLETPTSGNIYFNDKCVENTKVNDRNTSMVFQNYALFPHKTVCENIAFGLRMRKYHIDEINERVKKVIELVSIGGMEDRYPHQLSGGQQQRVALARAIVYNPDVLLLDEPLSALDKKLRDQMRFELRRIQQTVGITTIFVTHDQEEAMALSDRIIIMDKAKVVQEGSPDYIYRHPNNLYVANFLGTSNIFEGVVVNTGDQCFVKLENGDCIKPLFSEKDGTHVVMSARPQAFSFIKQSADDNEITAKFEAVSYLGTNLRYLFSFCGKQLVVETLNSDMVSNFTNYKYGENVKLYFSQKNIIRME